MKAQPFESRTCYSVETKEVNELSGLMFVIQT